MYNETNNKHLRVRYWIWLGYSFPIVVFLIVAGLLSGQIATLKSVGEDQARTVKVEREIGKVAFHTQILSRAIRGYLLDKNPTSVNSYQEAKNDLPESFQKLKELIQDEEQRQTLGKIEDGVAKLDSLNGELFTLVDQGKPEEAIARWKTNHGREVMEEITRLLDNFGTRQEDIVNKNTATQKAAIDSLFNTVVTFAGIAIVSSLLFGWWIIGTITRRLNQTTSILASSSSEIAATVEQQERTASQQAASVNETTTTMDELSASSRQSSEQADSASIAAQRALQMAEKGNEAVSETIMGMSDLKEKVKAISEQIMHLSEETHQIGNISQLVSDLANRTNMLALNAAVEAVRAGEHGKGFAVVASEIRKLADQSKQSAEKINTLVSEIQNSINCTVMVTDEGTKTVDSGMQITQKTAQSFAGVREAVNNMVMSNQQISLNIKQQAAAISQVLQAMNTINQGAKETANGISQTRIGTQRLNNATEDLKAIV